MNGFKFLKVLVWGATLSGALTANAQFLGAKGLNFVAPQVNGKGNVGNPQVGEIVYDLSNNGFWGYNGVTPWVSLSPNSLSLKSPTVSTFSSGTGSYTPPAGTLYIRVRLVGGGGGGAGSGPGSTGGTLGSVTGISIGGTLTIAANGGGGGAGGAGGAGGTSFILLPAHGSNFEGGNGSPATLAANMIGSMGGVSFFGGAGGGGLVNGNATSAKLNSGSGGGSGGATPTTGSNASGGAGGFVDAVIDDLTGPFTYVVGPGGNAGSGGGGGGNGGAGGNGYIEITEYYQ